LGTENEPILGEYIGVLRMEQKVRQGREEERAIERMF
jgi:hypothetical protein